MGIKQQLLKRHRQRKRLVLAGALLAFAYCVARQRQLGNVYESTWAVFEFRGDTGQQSGCGADTGALASRRNEQ